MFLVIIRVDVLVISYQIVLGGSGLMYPDISFPERF